MHVYLFCSGFHRDQTAESALPACASVEGFKLGSLSLPGLEESIHKSEKGIPWIFGFSNGFFEISPIMLKFEEIVLFFFSSVVGFLELFLLNL